MTRGHRSPRPCGPPEASDEDRFGAVLRVVGGEGRLAVARDLGVAVDDVDEWVRVFLEAGRDGIRSSREPLGETERLRAWARIGELTMRVDLLERFVARKGYADELASLEDEHR